ncbi:MAG: thioredoxin-like domain-containing protein [Actinomycetota bacterium]|nr:thioredoxin-like domain-containing protein [Actinomycetota bacterium]
MRLALATLALVLVAAACTTDTGDTSDRVETTAPVTTAGPIEDDRTIEPSYAGTVAAPPFPTGLDWLNTAEAIQLDDLQGKVVLLDFWTYGCINCIHIIPDLERLEEEYADELVVIGVHSAKFVNESATENIRQVVLRYGIEHPVVNDENFAVWQSWGAQAWPTIALVDPAGNVVGMHSGEGVYETVQPVIQALVAEFDDAGLVDRSPFEVTPESDNQANTILSYPGKVATGANRIFVSDTGHNRIIAANRTSGEILAVYGNGNAGFVGGPALSAEFDAPQGLAYDDKANSLYVADTNNHAIRAIDLATGAVETIAGTGQLGWPPAAGLLADVRLNSPWGLTLQDGKLWVAMAGFHQLWVIDLVGGVATPAVGSAREGVANGPLTTAELAQPSGLAFDATGRLYFADSESSSIRWADALDPDGTTGVLAGTDVNLFDFGDTDGIGTEARLQHPLGIVWDRTSGDLLIADTYNSKIKRIDPETGETTSYLGTNHGWADGTAPRFYEPGGLAVDDGILFVADTNNHVIRSVDLATGVTSTLILNGIQDFSPPPDDADFPGTIIQLDAVQIASGPGTLLLDIGLPAGYKVNEDAPSSVVFQATGGFVTLPAGNEQSLTGARLPVTIDAEFAAGAGLLTADVTLLYCRDDSEGLCVIEQVRFSQPLAVGASGSDAILLPYQVVLPDF